MRADLEIIQDWIPAGSRVLDLGCGDGELLAWLKDNKQVTGYGLENDADNIARTLGLALAIVAMVAAVGIAVLLTLRRRVPYAFGPPLAVGAIGYVLFGKAFVDTMVPMWGL